MQSKNHNKSEQFSAIIQARMGSNRLPNKVMKKFNGIPILEYVINQIKHSKKISELIIATTNKKIDKKIVDYCKEKNINYFCGSDEDVLDRFYQCAKCYNCKNIVRISADSPLIDPHVIDKVINFFNKKYDLVCNNLEKKNGKWEDSFCNFPQGMAVEVTSFLTLEKIWKFAQKKSEREHVFPYIVNNQNCFKIINIKNNVDLSQIRCTVDHIEDIKFIKKVLENIPKNKKLILIKDIEKIVRMIPEILDINSKIDPYEGYKISLKNDKL